jgi:hypothetical protein
MEIGYKRITEHGYILVFVGKEHHLADVNGYAYEHRLVAEEKLERKLLSEEIVHHIDHNRSNNDKENLEIYPSRWHHNSQHRRLPIRRQEPGQPNELIPCACGCGESIWRFNPCHVEVMFVSGHNMRLQLKAIRIPKPKQGEHNRRKTHCLKGHEFTTENTRFRGKHRICKTCHRIREYSRRYNLEG